MQAELCSIISCVLPIHHCASSNGDLLCQEKKPYATHIAIAHQKYKSTPHPSCLLADANAPLPPIPNPSSHHSFRLRPRPKIPSAGYYKATSPPSFLPSVPPSCPHLSNDADKGSHFCVQIFPCTCKHLCSPVNSPIYRFIQASVVHALMNDTPDDPINATGSAHP
jgi:hypothetical protein